MGSTLIFADTSAMAIMGHWEVMQRKRYSDARKIRLHARPRGTAVSLAYPVDGLPLRGLSRPAALRRQS